MTTHPIARDECSIPARRELQMQDFETSSFARPAGTLKITTTLCKRPSHPPFYFFRWKADLSVTIMQNGAQIVEVRGGIPHASFYEC